MMMRKKQVRLRTILSATGICMALIAAAVLAIAGPAFAHASSNYVGSGNGSQQTVPVVVTFYGYNDNSGQTENQYGSALIAYPQNGGYPTLHNLATEGAGTYNDPVTFAVRTNDQATFPIGSIAYFPLVHKYFIMEDECGDTSPTGCLNGTHHTDLWLGPQSASDTTALDNCENNSTPGSAVKAVINPVSTYPVDTTPMFQNNQCTIHLYDGNTVPNPGGSTPTPTPTNTPGTTPTVTTTPVSGGITNGGFETGDFTGWTRSGTTSISTTAHSGSYAAELGTNSPTNGDSSLKQTFTAPSGATGLSFYYDVRCPDDVTYDWATASLKDNTANTTATILPKTCTNTTTWVQVSSSITAGHSYTLTLTSHDENNPGDPTYTLYDDVTLTGSVSTPTPTPTTTPTPVSGGITNGGFETGDFTGWTRSGTTSISTTAHSGSYAAELGTNSPTNGDSSLKQTFTAPSGTTTLSFYYDVRCPDDVTYDWATASLKDNTTGTTTTILAKTCTNSTAWVKVSSGITVGHSYTLTLTSHDENNPGDPTYTLYDDVSLN